jgi:hypothetical protein
MNDREGDILEVTCELWGIVSGASRGLSEEEQIAEVERFWDRCGDRAPGAVLREMAVQLVGGQ